MLTGRQQTDMKWISLLVQPSFGTAPRPPAASFNSYYKMSTDDEPGIKFRQSAQLGGIDKVQVIDKVQAIIY